MKELEIIEYVRKRAGKPPKGVKLGIGDDCAVIDAGGEGDLLWASDMLVEDTHFRKKDGYKRIGYKAVAVNVSDIAAMGGIPKYITISIGVSEKMSKTSIKTVYDGIFSAAKKYGIYVIGGDTNKSDKFVIDVSIIGTAPKNTLIKRSGARRGDLVLITGPVRNGRKTHLDFVPRLEDSRFLTCKYNINSMIDTSDGIAMDMNRICDESKTGCILYQDAVPLSKGLSLDDALYYGESFELLFTMAVSEARKLFLDVGKGKWDPNFYVIGEIVADKKKRILIGKEGKAGKLKKKGYRHM